MAKTIAGTHCGYQWSDGRADMAWVAGLNTKTVSQ